MEVSDVSSRIISPCTFCPQYLHLVQKSHSVLAASREQVADFLKITAFCRQQEQHIMALNAEVAKKKSESTVQRNTNFQLRQQLQNLRPEFSMEVWTQTENDDAISPSRMSRCSSKSSQPFQDLLLQNDIVESNTSLFDSNASDSGISDPSCKSSAGSPPFNPIVIPDALTHPLPSLPHKKPRKPAVKRKIAPLDVAVPLQNDELLDEAFGAPEPASVEKNSVSIVVPPSLESVSPPVLKPKLKRIRKPKKVAVQDSPAKEKPLQDSVHCLLKVRPTAALKRQRAKPKVLLKSLSVVAAGCGSFPDSSSPSSNITVSMALARLPSTAKRRKLTVQKTDPLPLAIVPIPDNINLPCWLDSLPSEQIPVTESSCDFGPVIAICETQALPLETMDIESILSCFRIGDMLSPPSPMSEHERGELDPCKDSPEIQKSGECDIDFDEEKFLETCRSTFGVGEMVLPDFSDDDC